jgi:hypothetical protein
MGCSSDSVSTQSTIRHVISWRKSGFGVVYVRHVIVFSIVVLLFFLLGQLHRFVSLHETPFDAETTISQVLATAVANLFVPVPTHALAEISIDYSSALLWRVDSNATISAVNLSMATEKNREVDSIC